VVGRDVCTLCNHLDLNAGNIFLDSMGEWAAWA